MGDESRIEALKRRLQKDPGSIAFAQLAEEYRRAGRLRDAIDVCRSGLAMYPGYLSARVTLGRALLESGDVGGGERELSEVLRAAPDNLSAVRALADIHRRRGEEPDSLSQFRTAFEAASEDAAVDQLVRDIHRAEPPPAGPRHPVQAEAASGAPQAAWLSVGVTGRADAPPPVMDDQRAARRTLAYLERWLQAVLDDRRARLYAVQA